MFENFKAINLTIGFPSVSITKNGITFNKASLIKLSYPSHVKLMMDDMNHQMAIQICKGDDEYASAFIRNNRRPSYARWNNRDLIATISDMMTWNLEENGRKVTGKYIDDEKALLFELDKAEIIGKEE